MMELNHSSPEKGNSSLNGEDEDSFVELFKNSDMIMNDDVEDLDYMDELLNNIGTVEQDGTSERLENIELNAEEVDDYEDNAEKDDDYEDNTDNDYDYEDNAEKDDELSELLENSDNVSHGEKRDLTSPMSIDSGIELGHDLSALPNMKTFHQPCQNNDKRWNSYGLPSHHSNPPLPIQSPIQSPSSLGLEPKNLPSDTKTPPSYSATQISILNHPINNLNYPSSNCDSPFPHLAAPSPSFSHYSPNSTVTSSNSTVTSPNSTVTRSNSTVTSPNSTVTRSNSTVTSSNSTVTRSNSSATSTNSPVSKSNPSKDWKVEIIYNNKDEYSSKEKEKAYWRKRKREDRNKPVKRKKVAWSYEEAPRPLKKECPWGHYSYEEDDDFDDLYMFADMVGVNPGDSSDASRESDNSDDESDDEEYQDTINDEEKLSSPPRSSEVSNIPNSQPGDDQNSFSYSQHSPDASVSQIPEYPYHHVDPYISLVPDYLQQFSSSSHHPVSQSNPPNQFCDSKSSKNISSELISLRSPSKPKSSSHPSSNVIVPEHKNDYEKKKNRSSMTLRPKNPKDDEEEVFIKPELFGHGRPRCLTKTSRNKDRKVKLYEKGKMVNEKQEQKRLRALRAKLNRDRHKFEGMRTEERIKDLEKENEMLREEVEERKNKEEEGERRKMELEAALVESRNREKDLEKMLEEAKKREEKLINEIKEKQKREEELRVESGRGNGGMGKESEVFQVHP